MKEKYNTICVDFDKTLCSDDKFGEPNKRIVDIVKDQHNKERYIVIFTSRKKKYFYDIMDWCIINDIPFDDIICNKPEAVIYIDDRACHRDRIFMTSHIEHEIKALKEKRRLDGEVVK
jgi:hydroxymethylpyrimidine pyrophosphatase-like HAD family hydrolase